MDFADVIKVDIMRWGDLPGLSYLSLKADNLSWLKLETEKTEDNAGDMQRVRQIELSVGWKTEKGAHEPRYEDSL